MKPTVGENIICIPDLKFEKTGSPQKPSRVYTTIEVKLIFIGKTIEYSIMKKVVAVKGTIPIFIVSGEIINNTVVNIDIVVIVLILLFINLF